LSCACLFLFSSLNAVIFITKYCTSSPTLIHQFQGPPFFLSAILVVETKAISSHSLSETYINKLSTAYKTRVYGLSIVFILLFSSAVAGVITPNSDLSRRGDPKPQSKVEFDQETASFKQSGTCRLYDAAGNKDKRKHSSDICETKCGNTSDRVRDTNATASTSCESLGPEAKDRWSLDPDGDKYSLGGCACQVPLADIIINDVAAVLPRIGDILCVGLLTALRETLETAVNFIPK
jgi:hypothetical protein